MGTQPLYPKKGAEILRKEAGIGPDDIVLDGDPAPQKGHSIIIVLLYSAILQIMQTV